MRECECPKPNPRVTPGKENICVRCRFLIADRWSPTDDNLNEFFNRLSDCQHVEASFPQFRQMAEERVREGRETYGYRYMAADNLAEGLEEAADLAIYPLLDDLKMIREGRGGEDYDLVLTIAFHAAQAFDALVRLKQRRAGAP